MDSIQQRLKLILCHCSEDYSLNLSAACSSELQRCLSPKEEEKAANIYLEKLEKELLIISFFASE